MKITFCHKYIGKTAERISSSMREIIKVNPRSTAIKIISFGLWAVIKFINFTCNTWATDIECLGPDANANANASDNRRKITNRKQCYIKDGVYIWMLTDDAPFLNSTFDSYTLLFFFFFLFMRTFYHPLCAFLICHCFSFIFPPIYIHKTETNLAGYVWKMRCNRTQFKLYVLWLFY